MYILGEDLPDDPIVRRIERFGTAFQEDEEEEEEIPICPICREECDTMYVGMAGEVLGCDCCVHMKEPDDRFYPRRIARKLAGM